VASSDFGVSPKRTFAASFAFTEEARINSRMSRAEKLFDKLMGGRNDATFSFADLCTLLTKLGYTARHTKGSHIIFQRGSSFLNLQPAAGRKAKAYQVRQVRQELKNLNLKP